jgi:plasmid stabilization system protein ParE
MSRQLIVRSAAERDLLEAFRYYESVVPGLGAAFVQRVDEAMTAISMTPEGYRKRHGEFRLLVLRQFPYGVFYLFDGRIISIAAIVPLMRDPEFIRSVVER